MASGSEITTNGTFSSGAGWAFHGDPGFSITGGQLVAVDEAIAYAVNTGADIESGALYKLLITISNLETGSLSVYAETAPDTYEEQNLFDSSFDGDGSFTAYWVADANGDFTLRANAAILQADDISLKKYTLPA